MKTKYISFTATDIFFAKRVTSFYRIMYPKITSNFKKVSPKALKSNLDYVEWFTSLKCERVKKLKGDNFDI